MRRALLIAATGLLLAGCISGDAPQSWKELTAQGAYSAALSDDGQHAIVGSMQHGGSLWDVPGDARLFDWNHQQGQYTNIVAADFSPDGGFAATASTQDLVLWNVSDGKSIGYWSAPSEVLSLALAPLGDYALLGLANHEAVYFDIRNGGIRKTLRHPARVRAVALDRAANLALTGCDDHKVRLWDLDSGKQLQTLNFGNTVDTVALSDDGNLAFSSASLDRAVIWDTRTGKVLHSISGNEMFWRRRVSYLTARFSADGQQLLTGTASGTVQLWDTQSGKQLRRWTAHKREAYGPTSTGIHAVGFGSDSQYYAIGSNGLLNVLR